MLTEAPKATPLTYFEARTLFQLAYDAAEVIGKRIEGVEVEKIAFNETMVIIGDEGRIDVPGSIYDGCAGNQVWTLPNGDALVWRIWRGTTVVYGVVNTRTFEHGWTH